MERKDKDSLVQNILDKSRKLREIINAKDNMVKSTIAKKQQEMQEQKRREAAEKLQRKVKRRMWRKVGFAVGGIVFSPLLAGAIADDMAGMIENIADLGDAFEGFSSIVEAGSDMIEQASMLFDLPDLGFIAEAIKGASEFAGELATLTSDHLFGLADHDLVAINNELTDSIASVSALSLNS